ncbi:hypothetical protein DY000_02015908 [Brassica cretica]|uniref:Uncharacterized protein n=1 Tax=Brassica cretica TaxID=69181 RepID=A0ABQ7CYJ4_BRACR|nr:hypothetical protein DY000_02015908 [Brassica cretica]
MNLEDDPSAIVQVHPNKMGARRMSRWSGKTSSGTVSSVVWSWFQPKLHYGRTRDDPVHGSVSLIGKVGWGNLS